jgi:hypothetical protein
MAGRTTFRGAPLPTGALVPVAELRAATWQRMEAALARPIPPAMRAAITESLHVFAAVQAAGRPADRQSVKRTLAALASLKPEQLAEAVERCDPASRALLDAALFKARRSGSPSAGVDALREAAADALANLPASTGGRPADELRDLLAAWIVDRWRECGGVDCGAWSRDDSASPLVRFGCAIYDELHPLGTDEVRKLLASAVGKVSACD